MRLNLKKLLYKINILRIRFLRRRMILLKHKQKHGKTNMMQLIYLDNNNSKKFKSWQLSSKNHIMKSKNSRKTMLMWLMREISLVLNSLEEMMNWLFFMKRLRFFKVLSQEVRFNTKKDSKTFDFSNLRLETIRVNLELWNQMLLKFLIFERKFIIYRDNFWQRDFKSKLFQRN